MSTDSSDFVVDYLRSLGRTSYDSVAVNTQFALFVLVCLCFISMCRIKLFSADFDSSFLCWANTPRSHAGYGRVGPAVAMSYCCILY